MKIFKRNAVIITVLLFVAVAVYLNWSYNRGQDLSLDSGLEAVGDAGSTNEENADTTGDPQSGNGTAGKEGDDANTYFGEKTTDSSAANYFATARLTREQARDSATAILQEAAALKNASQEEVDSMLEAISVISDNSLKEAAIENLLIAKEFSDCVVFIDGDSVSVVVPAPQEGLSKAAAARIMETVIGQVAVSPENIKIVEVK